MEDDKTQRRLSPLGAWAIVLGCIISWGSFVMPGTSFLPSAGPTGTAIAMGIACVIMLVFALCFHYMMNRVPVNGGAFAFAFTAFGRSRGFLCGWFLSLAYLAPIALNATALALVARNLMGNALEFGLHYNVAGYDTYLGEILTIVVVLGLVAWAAAMRRNILAKVQVVLVTCLVVGVAIIFIACMLDPDAAFFGAQPEFSPRNPPVMGVLVVLAASPWLFIGFDTLSQSTSEFSFSPRKSGAIMASAIVVGALIYTGLDCVGASVVPKQYGNWLVYVMNTPSLSGIEALPVFNATYHVLGEAGVIVLDIAILGAVLSGIVGFFIADIRLLQAVADAHVLPDWFGKLHPQRKTPRNAIVFVFAVAVMASLFGRTILNWVMDMASAGLVLGLLYTSLATFTYARRERGYAFVAIGILGTVLSVAFLVLLFIPIPMLNASMGLESIVFLIAWATLGMNYYTPPDAIIDEVEALIPAEQ